MGNILRNRRIMSSSNVSNTSGGGTDPLDKIRITNLENNEYKITYFTEISAAAGAESPPTGATILLDELQSGADAYVSTLQGGKPSGQMPVTSGGVKVDVATFDALGNYTLTGTPSSYPVALIYTLKIKALNYSNLNLNNILELEEIGLIPAANIVEDSDHNFVTDAEKNKLAALDNRKSNKMVAYKNTDTTLTGTASHTVMIGDLLLPASEITNNSRIDIEANIFGEGTAGNKTFRIYLSRTPNDLTGATLMATYISATIELSRMGDLSFSRRIVCKNNKAINNVYPPTVAAAYEIAITTNARVVLNWDFSIDTYFIITGQLANTATIMGVDNVQIRVTNP